MTCARWIGLESRETSSVHRTSWILKWVQTAVSISDFARALILDFNFVGKIRVIPSTIDSILCSPIPWPAISRSHICASRQSASLDAVDLERGIKLMSPSVRMGVSASDNPWHVTSCRPSWLLYDSRGESGTPVEWNGLAAASQSLSPISSMHIPRSAIL